MVMSTQKNTENENADKNIESNNTVSNSQEENKYTDYSSLDLNQEDFFNFFYNNNFKK